MREVLEDLRKSLYLLTLAYRSRRWRVCSGKTRSAHCKHGWLNRNQARTASGSRLTIAPCHWGFDTLHTVWDEVRSLRLPLLLSRLWLLLPTVLRRHHLYLKDGGTFTAKHHFIEYKCDWTFCTQPIARP